MLYAKEVVGKPMIVVGKTGKVKYIPTSRPMAWVVNHLSPLVLVVSGVIGIFLIAPVDNIFQMPWWWFVVAGADFIALVWAGYKWKTLDNLFGFEE